MSSGPSLGRAWPLASTTSPSRTIRKKPSFLSEAMPFSAGQAKEMTASVPAGRA